MLNIRNLRYAVDEGFWKDLTREEAAYTLGFLCADGGITFRYGTVEPKSWYVASSDVDILEKVKVACGYTGPIRAYEFPKHLGYKKAYRLDVGRKGMVRDLIKLGLIQDKGSLSWVGDSVPVDGLRHFCRGLHDGDGCLRVYPKDGYTKLALEHVDGSYALVCGLAGAWGAVLGAPVHVGIGTGASWRVVVGGSKAAKLVEWMYTGASIFMDRRKKRVDEVLSLPWPTKGEVVKKYARLACGRFG